MCVCVCVCVCVSGFVNFLHFSILRKKISENVLFLERSASDWSRSGSGRRGKAFIIHRIASIVGEIHC